MENNQIHDVCPNGATKSQTLVTLEQLTERAKKQQEKFDNVSLLDRFFTDYHELASWINAMKIKILTDKVATDLDSVKALLQKHCEYKSEIDNHDDKFKVNTAIAQQLLDDEEIESKLLLLSSDRDSLLALWERRCTFYDQYINLQVLHQQMDQMNTWMADQEALLTTNRNVICSYDPLEYFLKKREDVTKAIVVKDQIIKSIDEFATELINKKHYAAEDISQWRTKFLERYSTLKELLLYDYERDRNEIKKWIDKKYLNCIGSNKVKYYKHFKMKHIGPIRQKANIVFTRGQVMDTKRYATSHIQPESNEILRLLETLVRVIGKGVQPQETNQQRGNLKLQLSTALNQSSKNYRKSSIFSQAAGTRDETDSKEKIGDFEQHSLSFGHVAINEINIKRSEIFNKVSKLKASVLSKCCKLDEGASS